MTIIKHEPVVDGNEDPENLRRQLEHADRLATVGQLAAGIAHELNGPLGNILGYAQLASKYSDLPEQVYMDLDHIVRFALHAREIVKKIMLFSRQVPPMREYFCLNQVVRDGLYLTEPLLVKSKVEVICELQSDLPKMIGDPGQLRQVVVNLIVNAVQAMPEGGDILIATRGEGSEIALTVTDNGSGMDAETREKCFLPFFTTKDVDQGTGLGLSVVHGIVKAHGGRMQVMSKPNEGTRFSFWFPLE